ncbi:hypothetical protein B0J17DRAFT_686509 [Rhizoctonia solani]|nr:hypothetical protein B0J17DRAFT_686509 [Rhizoctonia solani]
MEPPNTYTTLIPRLPEDIVYLVGNFSSFESLSSLVRCSKWLYRICFPLLFREIRLRSPTQIIKLDKNQKAMQMISRTNLYRESWELKLNMYPDATVGHIIIRILRAMTSLIRLEISGRRVSKLLAIFRNMSLRRISRQFAQMLSASGDDSSFLPNLAFVNEFFTGISLRHLCPDRSVVYHCSLDSHRLHLDICPGLGERGTASGRIPEVTHSFSAQDIGSIIRNAEPTVRPSCTPTSTLDLIMRFPDEISQHKPCPIRDTLSWTLTMLATTGLPTNQLRSIDVRFEPPPLYQSLSAQLSASAGISFPRTKWSRKGFYSRVSPHCESSSSGNDLIWTVCPQLKLPETINWWYDAMNLGDLDAQNNEELKRKAEELWDAMSSRWGKFRVPTKEGLINHLRNYK